jgi:hypothetical protein
MRAVVHWLMKHVLLFRYTASRQAGQCSGRERSRPVRTNCRSAAKTAATCLGFSWRPRVRVSPAPPKARSMTGLLLSRTTAGPCWAIVRRPPRAIRSLRGHGAHSGRLQVCSRGLGRISSSGPRSSLPSVAAIPRGEALPSAAAVSHLSRQEDPAQPLRRCHLKPVAAKASIASSQREY